MNQLSFDELFADGKKEVTKNPPPSPLRNEIIAILESGETSALQICERLIFLGKISNDRFSTNKPKEYGKVCSILENLVVEGVLRFLEEKDKKDRIYELKNDI